MKSIPLTAQEVRALTDRSNQKPANEKETEESLYEMVWNRHFFNLFNAINKKAAIGGDSLTFTIEFNSDIHRQVYHHLTLYLAIQNFGVQAIQPHALEDMDEATLTISW